MRRAPADTRCPSATVNAYGTAHSSENSSEPHGVTMLSLIGLGRADRCYGRVILRVRTAVVFPAVI